MAWSRDCAFQVTHALLCRYHLAILIKTECTISYLSCFLCAFMYTSPTKPAHLHKKHECFHNTGFILTAWNKHVSIRHAAPRCERELQVPELLLHCNLKIYCISFYYTHSSFALLKLILIHVSSFYFVSGIVAAV